MTASVESKGFKDTLIETYNSIQHYSTVVDDLKKQLKCNQSNLMNDSANMKKLILIAERSEDIKESVEVVGDKHTLRVVVDDELFEICFEGIDLNYDVKCNKYKVLNR